MASIDDFGSSTAALTAARDRRPQRRRDEAGDDRCCAYFLARAYAPALAARRGACSGFASKRTADSRTGPRDHGDGGNGRAAPAHLLARGAYDAPRRRRAARHAGGAAAVRRRPAAQPARARALADRPRTIRSRRAWPSTGSGGCISAAASSRRRKTSAARDACRSHPELLDWLAARFMESGWDVKALHRLIVTSATYRQSSHATPEQLRDRIRTTGCSAAGPPRASAGRGDPRQRARRQRAAGRGRSAARASSRTSRRDCGSSPGTGKTYTAGSWREAVSPQSVHVLAPDLAAAVDDHLRRRCRARSAPPGGRCTTTPLQALVLLNDPQFVEAARVLAERLLRDVSARPGGAAPEAFRALTGRAPDDAKPQSSRRLFEEQRACSRPMPDRRAQPARGRRDAAGRRAAGRRRRRDDDRGER